MKDFIHVLPRGLFFYQNEFYDAVFGDKTDYPESLKDFLFTRTGDIEAAGEFYGAIEKWPQERLLHPRGKVQCRKPSHSRI